MGTLEIRVLGPVVAEVDETPLALGSPQQRAVLAALIMSAGSVVSRDGLVDRLWPEEPPASASKIVQKHVSGLRASLGSQVIETSGGGYVLAIDPARSTSCGSSRRSPTRRGWEIRRACHGAGARRGGVAR